MCMSRSSGFDLNALEKAYNKNNEISYERKCICSTSYNIYARHDRRFVTLQEKRYYVVTF